MKISRYTDRQILAILKQAEARTPVRKLRHEHGMSSASFYKWRSEYDGTDAPLMAYMKELEDKNQQLKKMYAEEQLKVEIAQEALTKMGRPSHRRGMAQRSVAERGLSIRVACAAFAISMTCYCYHPSLSDKNAEIADWLLRLTGTHRRWGFGLCFYTYATSKTLARITSACIGYVASSNSIFRSSCASTRSEVLWIS